MSEATLLESRLSKVEQDNRRLKLTVGALLLALAAVPLIGAVMPQEIPDLITAREFRVVDENGTERAYMRDTGFWYSDEDGTLRFAMNELGLSVRDENGNLRVMMTDVGIGYYDENGTPVWSTECAPNC